MAITYTVMCMSDTVMVGHLNEASIEDVEFFATETDGTDEWVNHSFISALLANGRAMDVAHQDIMGDTVTTTTVAFRNPVSLAKEA